MKLIKKLFDKDKKYQKHSKFLKANPFQNLIEKLTKNVLEMIRLLDFEKAILTS